MLPSVIKEAFMDPALFSTWLQLNLINIFKQKTKLQKIGLLTVFLTWLFYYVQHGSRKRRVCELH